MQQLAAVGALTRLQVYDAQAYETLADCIGREVRQFKEAALQSAGTSLVLRECFACLFRTSLRRPAWFGLLPWPTVSLQSCLMPCMIWLWSRWKRNHWSFLSLARCWVRGAEFSAVGQRISPSPTSLPRGFSCAGPSQLQAIIRGMSRSRPFLTMPSSTRCSGLSIRNALAVSRAVYFLVHHPP
eukprot:2265343-Amphidinium_carterae.1